MAEKYFEKFQTIKYANTIAVNLTERSTLLGGVMSNPFLFYQYDITNGIRADQIADDYYDDQFMSWIIYLSNQTIDPYYQWYLNPEDFDSYLKKKYGVDNTDQLKQKVKFWRNNWYNYEQITPQEYDQMIDATTLEKYWEPVYIGSYKPVAYQRKQEDWVTDTNNTVIYNTAHANTYVRNEIVDIHLQNDVNGGGSAQVASANDTHLVVKHTFGNVVPSVGDTGFNYIYGRESQSNNFILDTKQILVNGDTLLPSIERIYWDPVYIWDYENELNENNKSIKVLNKMYSQQAAAELKDLMG